MEKEELLNRLNTLVGRKLTEATQAGSALFMKIAQVPNETQERTLLLFPDWVVLFSDGVSLDNSRFGSYEHNFETKAEWQKYQEQADEDRNQLNGLLGFEVQDIKLCSEGSLEIKLDNKTLITSAFDAEKYENLNFMLIDPTENLTCSFSREGIRSEYTKVGQVVANRTFTFRKAGKDFPATIQFGLPYLRERGDEELEDYCCSYEISCELGGCSGGRSGVDSLQSLLLALIGAQADIDKLAEKFEAEAFYLGEDLSPVYKFRDEFDTLHNLMNRLYTETHFDKQFSASPEGLKCLARMNEVLTMLKEFRSDKKP